MSSKSITLGIDVSKKQLEAASWPNKQRWQFSNDASGHRKLDELIAQLDCDLVVLEATGGLEEACVEYLLDNNRAVEVVNARQARRFAEAMGRLEKTDRIDAVGLAHFAQVVEPTTTELPEPAQKRLKDLVRRRQQLIEMRSAEKTRRHRVSRELALQSIEATIEHLSAQIAALENEIRRLLETESLQERYEVLTSAPGVAERTATRVMANMPELGALNRKEVAKLGGLAPLCNDSGQKQGDRECYGGRARVRHAMYLAATNAIRCCEPIRNFYNRLKDRGKETKVAMTAAARKLLTILNSMMKHDAKFDPEKAMPKN